MKRGFSLVEMLVVVSIIAILAGVGLSVFTGSNKKAHDAKQKADIESIRSSLELYKADSNGYPLTTANLIPNYLPAYPTPPAGGSYPYTSSGCTTYCSSYSVCATLEIDGSTYCGIPGGIVITPAAPAPTAVPTIAPTSTPVPTAAPTPAGACGGACRPTCIFGEVSQGQQDCEITLTCCVREGI